MRKKSGVRANADELYIPKPTDIPPKIKVVVCPRESPCQKRNAPQVRKSGAKTAEMPKREYMTCQDETERKKADSAAISQLLKRMRTKRYSPRTVRSPASTAGRRRAQALAPSIFSVMACPKIIESSVM